MNQAPIAYTLGEPAGIGVDLIIQLAQQHKLEDIVCIGDERSLRLRAAKMGLRLELIPAHNAVEHFGQIRLNHVPCDAPEVCGEASVDNATAVLAMLDTAIDGCLAGEFTAMVTGPLHKGIINEAGIPFTGHTEYLEQRCGAGKSVMLLQSKQLRVALMTTHLPLADVSSNITPSLIDRVCRIIEQDLRQRFAIKQPHLLLCGLNPHAGEDGHMGMEEIDTISPSIERLRADGIKISGPIPADTAFTQRRLADVDVVVAMYHDQGLPVIKAQSFGEAANITLGLPIIRTSVDHGTAFDLVASGKAETGGLECAIQVAREMLSNKQTAK